MMAALGETDFAALELKLADQLTGWKALAPEDPTPALVIDDASLLVSPKEKQLVLPRTKCLLVPTYHWKNKVLCCTPVRYDEWVATALEKAILAKGKRLTFHGIEWTGLTISVRMIGRVPESWAGTFAALNT